jgi:hypothetical protein
MDLETMPKSAQPHTLNYSLKVSKFTLKIRARSAHGQGIGKEFALFIQNQALFRSK